MYEWDIYVGMHAYSSDFIYVCVAVCCSVLQCVAVCCSVLQCVAVCCSTLQNFALCCISCDACLQQWLDICIHANVVIYEWDTYVFMHVYNAANVVIYEWDIYEHNAAKWSYHICLPALQLYRMSPSHTGTRFSWYIYIYIYICICMYSYIYMYI